MGQASASSSSSSAIQGGGNISDNSSFVAWIVIGVIALLGLLVFLKTRKH